jgi:AraC-like DNA-binding protein
MSGFNAVAQSGMIAGFERTFREATGMWVRLVPSCRGTADESACVPANPFCALVRGTAATRALCARTCMQTVRRAAETLDTQSCRCFAGFSIVAVPVIAGHDHLATLLAGHVFQKKPRSSTIKSVTRELRSRSSEAQFSMAHRAYLRTPIIGERHFQARVRLLKLFARQLAEYANHSSVIKDGGSPPCVCAAREFARQHLAERITMRDAARHVHLSPHYFCKIFHKATGLTFTEYLARLRVEKARGLLHNSGLRITEVAFGAGFQSISQFNAVFRKHAGQSPTEFRTALCQQFSI